MAITQPPKHQQVPEKHGKTGFSVASDIGADILQSQLTELQALHSTLGALITSSIDGKNTQLINLNNYLESLKSTMESSITMIEILNAAKASKATILLGDPIAPASNPPTKAEIDAIIEVVNALVVNQNIQNS